MIRHTLLFALVISLAIYAFRDWFKSLCGLILLMSVIEHPDMPKTMLGIQGLNPWNVLLLFVVLGWLTSRGREGLTWDMPLHMNLLLVAYCLLVVIGFGRMLFDRHGSYTPIAIPLEEYSSSYIFSEYFVNTFKWVVPGLLLFDGCRSRERFNLALLSTLAIYFLLALQVIKWMPITSVLHGDELTARSSKILLKQVGYHRVNLSMLLGGASWAIFSTRVLRQGGKALMVLGASVIVLYGQALTGGRTGYAAWMAVGLVLCLLRWRRYLLLVPVLIAVIVAVVPGVEERMLQGFTPETRDYNAVGATTSGDQEKPDDYTITAGRTLIWPYVIDLIKQRPWVGYGRLAMVRTGLKDYLWTELAENFPHPHNAYLELLFDNGWVGFCIVIPFYLAVLGHAFVLFRDSRSPIFVAIGGTASALVMALLFASVGSQTFYPREGAVGMWCAIGLVLRVSVERSRALAIAAALVRKVRATAPSAPATLPAPPPLAAPPPVPPSPASPPARRPTLVTLDGLLWARPA